MQIVKGIYQLSGDLMGLTYVDNSDGYGDANSYIIDLGERLIMFDCGSGLTWGQIENNMKKWDLDINKLTHCLLTHPHYDHAGAAHILSERGIKIVAHEKTADAVSTGDFRCCGYLYHQEFKPVKTDIILRDNETITIDNLEIKVLHMPGHTDACTLYLFEWNGEKFGVSGDIIGTLLAGDFGWNGSIDFNKPMYIESLKRFALIDMDIMLPGHGMVYFHKPRKRIEQVLNSALMQWR